MCGKIGHISENIEIDKRNVKIGGLSHNLFKCLKCDYYVIALKDNQKSINRLNWMFHT